MSSDTKECGQCDGKGQIIDAWGIAKPAPCLDCDGSGRVWDEFAGEGICSFCEAPWDGASQTLQGYFLCMPCTVAGKHPHDLPGSQYGEADDNR